MRCPVCKAENEATESCRRCRADLRLLLEVEQHQQQALAAAAAALSRGDVGAAQRHADRARPLWEDVPCLSLQGLLCLLRGEFAEALHLHQKVAGTFSDRGS